MKKPSEWEKCDIEICTFIFLLFCLWVAFGAIAGMVFARFGGWGFFPACGLSLSYTAATFRFLMWAMDTEWKWFFPVLVAIILVPIVGMISISPIFH